MLVSNVSQGSEIQIPARPVGCYIREVAGGEGGVLGPTAIQGAAKCGDAGIQAPAQHTVGLNPHLCDEWKHRISHWATFLTLPSWVLDHLKKIRDFVPTFLDCIHGREWEMKRLVLWSQNLQWILAWGWMIYCSSTQWRLCISPPLKPRAAAVTEAYWQKAYCSSYRADDDRN